MSKILIIGAGASGMMAAIAAAKNGNEVHIYEKNEKLGKKLYITGKGRCNITNATDTETLLNQIVSNKKFMYSALYGYTNQDVIDFFEDAGVALKNERGNRIFPVSDKSYDVIAALSKRMDDYGVKVHLHTEVKELQRDENRVIGFITTKGSVVLGDCVIIATGGFSYQTTGSTGDGYQFAKSVGHKVTDILPALVPMEVKENLIKDLQGLSLKNVEAGIYTGKKSARTSSQKCVYKAFGEMLFTHFGVSGPIILSASSYITKRMQQNKDDTLKLKIDLKPALTKEQLNQRILRDFSANVNKDFRNALDALLPKKIIPVIIEFTGIDPYKKINTITKEERGTLVTCIKEFTLTIVRLRGFGEAIITQGGVSVNEINPSTMESKLIKNLFFVGEVLDVDGLTGGINLQIAWSTGHVSGNSISSE